MYSAFRGVLRGLMGFPIEQPMESIKTQWQANPSKTSEVAIMKSIYKEKGIYKGFFAGSLPNAGRVVIKNLYRYPVMIGMPIQIENTMRRMGMKASENKQL